MKKIVFLALRIVVSLALMVVLFWMMRKDLGRIFSTIIFVNKPVFFAIFLLNLLTTFFLAYRMMIILKALNINITLPQSFRLYFIGYFFNNFLPTSVGGDMMKAYLVSKTANAKKLESFTGVFMDRVSGMIAILSLPALTLIFLKNQIENKLVVWMVYILFAIALATSILLFTKSFANFFKRFSNRVNLSERGLKMQRIFEAINIYKRNKHITIKAYLISFGSQIICFAGLYFLARAIFPHTPFLKFFLMQPLVIVASMLPSLNGLGIREGAFVYLLTPIMGKENAFTLSLLWLAMILILSLMGGVMYAMHGQFREVKND